MARGRMIDKCISILHEPFFELLSEDALDGLNWLFLYSDRDGWLDFSNPYDSGLIYSVEDLAFIMTYKTFNSGYVYIKKTQSKTIEYFIKVLNELVAMEIIELESQSIHIHGHGLDWIWRIRKNIEPHIRKNIFERDRGRCRYCGKELETRFHIDHLVPFSKGGVDEEDNFVLSCPECNFKKGNKTLEESGMELRKE